MFVRYIDVEGQLTWTSSYVQLMPSFWDPDSKEMRLYGNSN